VRYGYDPGCFRRPDGRPSDDRAGEVALALGLPLEEIAEPAGCPASGLAMNGIPAYARVGRFLALAGRQLAEPGAPPHPPTVVTPCCSCFRSLSRASLSLDTHEELRRSVAEELAGEGLSLVSGIVLVRHLLDVLLEDAGPEAIRARVTRPLSGRRVAPYHGCLGNPPGGTPPAIDPSRPGGRLGRVLSALGAEIAELPLTAHCCGGRAAEASEETASSLLLRILRSAAEAGADSIAAACPRCARNLASGQDAVNRRYGTRFAIPVRYFTSFAAEAFGLDAPAPSAPGRGLPSARGGAEGTTASAG
jgi:heterodisulfide reductase subunit B